MVMLTTSGLPRRWSIFSGLSQAQASHGYESVFTRCDERGAPILIGGVQRLRQLGNAALCRGGAR